LVEEDIRGMSLDTVAVGVFSIAGVLLGTLVGLWQGRKQTQYQRRADVVTELRQRMRETLQAMAVLCATPEHRVRAEVPPRVEQAELTGDKLDRLANYHEDHAMWLNKRVNEKLEAFTDEIALRWGQGQAALGAEDEEEVMGELRDWVDEALQQADEIRAEFDHLLKVGTPRWRRMFG
jgi:hypothetical protein